MDPEAVATHRIMQVDTSTRTCVFRVCRFFLPPYLRRCGRVGRSRGGSGRIHGDDLGDVRFSFEAFAVRKSERSR